ncbi:LPXTG cell wall anchor domain-containing protein [Bacillus sp. LR_6]|uniref:LPXTG cell wall anchor domain-containing protein n=1 Tax=Bacillus sp. LR_6 TaxID=3055785 RepID=UPI0035BF90AB
MNVVSKGSEKPNEPAKPSKPTSEPSKPTPEKTSEKTNAGNELPNTATNTYNLILVGLVLLVAGTALWYFRRKRNA